MSSSFKIGKSNLLCLIDSVLSAKSFNEKDFADINLPIEVEVSLFLNDEEIGLFDDLCDPQNISNINIIAKQDKLAIKNRKLFGLYKSTSFDGFMFMNAYGRILTVPPPTNHFIKHGSDKL